MTDVGQDYFSYKLSEKFRDKVVFVIFNNGKGVQISEGKNSINCTKYPYGTFYTDEMWYEGNGVESIPPTGHNHTLIYHEAVSATETKPGSKSYYSCTGCDKLYSDPAGLNEVVMEELIIPPVTQKDTDVSKSEVSKSEESKTEESKPVVPSDDFVPKTGDKTAFVVIILAAASGFAAFVIIRRKDRAKQ